MCFQSTHMISQHNAAIGTRAAEMHHPPLHLDEAADIQLKVF